MPQTTVHLPVTTPIMTVPSLQPRHSPLHSLRHSASVKCTHHSRQSWAREQSYRGHEKRGVRKKQAYIQDGSGVLTDLLELKASFKPDVS